MSDKINQAERLLATIMAARGRVRGLASGLPFDAATRLEARGTVGTSPARQDMEVVHEVLDGRVRAWRRSHFGKPDSDAEVPSAAASPLDPPADATELPHEDPLFSEFLAPEDPETEVDPPEGEIPWDAPEDLAPPRPLSPPDVLPEAVIDLSQDPPEPAQPIATEEPEEREIQAPAAVAQAPEPSAPASVASEQAPGDPGMPLAPPDLPPILNAAPPVRKARRRQTLPPAHPALATAAPLALSQPKPVAPRIVDPDAPGLAIDFEAGPPRADGPFLEAPPELTPTTQAQMPHATPTEMGTAEVFDVLAHAMQATREGRLAEAILLFSDVLDMEPTHMDARIQRGRAHMEMGQYTEAMSDFQRAEDGAPQSPESMVAMGDLFFARKNYAQAIHHYDQSLDLNPSHAMAFCRRGICYHYQRRPDLALSDLSQAQELDPEIPNIARYVRMVSTNPHSR